MANKFKPGIKSLQQMHTAMMVALILFGFVVCKYLETNPLITDNKSFKILQVVFVALSFLAAYFSFKRLGKKLQAIRGKQVSIDHKINDYRTITVVHYFILESIVTLNIVGYYLTQNTSFIALSIAFFILFALQVPTILLVTKHLMVKREDILE